MSNQLAMPTNFTKENFQHLMNLCLPRLRMFTRVHAHKLIGSPPTYPLNIRGIRQCVSHSLCSQGALPPKHQKLLHCFAGCG